MNYVLLSIREKVGTDKNRGVGGSADVSGGSGRAIVDHRNNLTRFMMHVKVTISGADLAAEKAASNRRRGRGGDPGHPPMKIGLAKLGLLGRLEGIEASD